ncbi:MAG: zinc ribbon domain-containing protein [Betaproteobacteria bacterium]|nr:zinc ribbon domain-containing protein [Betaproteobacteria bacterium]
MPIYEYRCSSCGFQKEYLQKVTDPLLTDCPDCGQRSLNKMVTAAGFQLKGSGWYATDFKGPAKPGADKAKPANDETAKSEPAKSEATKSESAKSDAPACGAGGCAARPAAESRG